MLRDIMNGDIYSMYIYIIIFMYIYIDIKNWDVAKDGTANTAIDDGWLLIDTYCYTLVKSE